MGKNILICPLNWGLGHATRCVPIIKCLLELGHNPIIAADKAPLSFLQKEFPNLKFIKLKGFEPIYSKSNSQVLKLLTLIPKALRNFNKEHKEIEHIVKNHNIDIIISDNRFGCWSKNIHSVFITHQLNIQAPKFIGWTSFFINKLNKSYIKNYDELWIPDVKEEPSLSGILSHPAYRKTNTTYIGLLSRFSTDNINENKAVKKTIDHLVILSGPEPQRTILENLVIEQASDIKGNIVILRAKPESDKLPEFIPDNITFHNHIDDNSFVELVNNSKKIICRGGYSSLMDLVKLNRNAFLVPTPGQTEQEYLADYLTKKGLFNSCKQKNFQLKNVNIPDIKTRKYFGDDIDDTCLKIFLDNWITKISKN